MALTINTIDELAELVQKLGLTVESPADLGELLQSLQRMRALETGQVLLDPDAAQAQAEVLKGAAESAGWIGALVAPGLAGIAVGATALLLQDVPERYVIAALGIVWGVCGVIGLVAVIG